MRNKFYKLIVILHFSILSLFAGGGDLVWKYPVYIHPLYRTDLVLSDEIDGVRYIYVVEDCNKLYALNSATGELKWIYNVEEGVDSILSYPCYSDEVIFLGGCHKPDDNPRHGRLLAINARDASLKWEMTDTSGYSRFREIIVSKDKIFGCTGNYTCAYRKDNGEIIWINTDMYDSCGYSISEKDKLLYLESTGIKAVFMNNGDTKWEYRDATGGTIYRDGVVYPNGPIIALNSSTGEIIWKAKTGDYEGAYGIPCIHNGRFYLSSDSKYAYCGDIKNGSKIWESYLGASAYLKPCAGNETVYTGSEFGYLYALNANTGEWKWIFKTEGSVYMMNPCIGDSLVYILSKDGYLYAVSLGEKIGFKEKQTFHHLPSPSLSAYPNPFKDKLVIESKTEGTVYNITGQKLESFNKGKHSIDTSKWREGVYIVKSGMEYKRIIKI